MMKKRPAADDLLPGDVGACRYLNPVSPCRAGEYDFGAMLVPVRHVESGSLCLVIQVFVHHPLFEDGYRDVAGSVMGETNAECPEDYDDVLVLASQAYGYVFRKSLLKVSR